MKVKWAISNQHTEFGLFKVGHIIDMTALGVPDEAVSSWIKDGYAIGEPEKPDKPKKIKKTMGGKQHG